MYPGCPEVMEIESPTKEILDRTIKFFGLTEAMVCSSGVNERRRIHFGIEQFVDNLTFFKARRLLSPFVSKNREFFDKLIKFQYKIASTT